MSVSSPNLRKVLEILTDTADIDACVIERVRVSVSSPNLRIVFGIARSGKALLRTKYIYLSVDCTLDLAKKLQLVLYNIYHGIEKKCAAFSHHISSVLLIRLF